MVAGQGLLLGDVRRRRCTDEQALAVAGEVAIYYQTKLRGASNKKARETFNFNPRRLEWLNR